MKLDDVVAFVTALPGVVVGTKWGNRTWMVGDKGFAWERPFSKADIKRYRPLAPPDGPIIAIATEDLGEKEAILAADQPGFFTISHFEGYPALLIQLDVVDPNALREALVDAWLCCAPPDLADAYLEQNPPT